MRAWQWARPPVYRPWRRLNSHVGMIRFRPEAVRIEVTHLLLPRRSTFSPSTSARRKCRPRRFFGVAAFAIVQAGTWPRPHHPIGPAAKKSPAIKASGVEASHLFGTTRRRRPPRKSLARNLLLFVRFFWFFNSRAQLRQFVTDPKFSCAQYISSRVSRVPVPPCCPRSCARTPAFMQA